MQKLINQTQEFLYDVLSQSEYDQHEIDYRYEHSLRVANIGLDLAVKEKANKKVVVLGCLLHDLGKFESEKGIDHGRVSAELAKPYLKTLNLSEKEITDICFSIATHVDGKAGYEYEDIIEAKIVTDADNIDRFSSSKILQTRLWDLNEVPKTTDEKMVSIQTLIKKLEGYTVKDRLETSSGNHLFKEKLDLQLHFYSSLLRDLKMTTTPKWLFD